MLLFGDMFPAVASLPAVHISTARPKWDRTPRAETISVFKSSGAEGTY